MLKIGDFSRLAQVSIKALRYYDETGLLKPAEVDRFSGYRYYTLDQLHRLNRILMLKDLGLSLEQVAQMLNNDLKADEMLRLLQIKRMELHASIEDAQAQLTRLERRIRQIEMEAKMPDYQIMVKRIESQQVLCIRQLILTVAEVWEVFDEVRAAAQNANIKQSGPWIVLYHHAGYRDHDLDVEFAVPVLEIPRDPVVARAEQRMLVRVIPPIETTVTIQCQGRSDELGSGYTALNTHIHEHGYNYLGPAREVYLRGLDASRTSGDYLIEIQYPIGEFTGETIIDGIELSSPWNDGFPNLPFSRRARTALEFAEQEAAALQESEIRPAHVLLGLLRDSEGFAGHVLGELGITVQQARTSMSSESSAASDHDLVVTDSARQLISYADAEARKLGHDYIGTEHLLLGLARQQEASLLRLLTTNGMSAEQIQRAVLQEFKR